MMKEGRTNEQKKGPLHWRSEPHRYWGQTDPDRKEKIKPSFDFQDSFFFSSKKKKIIKVRITDTKYLPFAK